MKKKRLKSGIEITIKDDVIFLPYLNLYFDDVKEIYGYIVGSVTSATKKKTSAENGKKGGRPKGVKNDIKISKI